MYGQYREYIDNYTICIEKKKKIYQLIGIEAGNTKQIIDGLNNAIRTNKKTLKYSITYSIGSSYIIIPRWAFKDLKDEIYRLLGYKETKVNMEE